MAYATSTYLAAAAIAAAVAGTGVSVYSQQQQAKTAERAAEYNNKLAEAEARNRELESAEQSKRQAHEKRRAMASYRARIANSGFVSTAGTPLAVLGESAGNMQTEIDDAYRASQMAASSFRSQGAMGLWEASQAKSAANLSSIGTLLSGASRIAGSYYNFRDDGSLGRKTY